MTTREKHHDQICAFGTTKDTRAKNGKVFRLLNALAVELKDLPFEQQRNIDYIINDLQDGYKFNWLSTVDFNRAHIQG